MTKAQQQITKRFPKSRFFDRDPRTDKHVQEWDHTHDWFILRDWKDLNVKLWVDVGFGFYALQVGDRVEGFGKDIIQTPEWVFLGEYYNDNLVLAKVAKTE